MKLFEYFNSEPRWFSFENPDAKRGAAAKENHGAKGHAFEYFSQGETKVLADFSGMGVIRRIWITFDGLDDKNIAARILNSVSIQMYWDHEDRPSVDVPVGNFFLFGAGALKPYENELFSSPEGRSFVCYIPMPFCEHARIQLVNRTGFDIKRLYYDVDMTLEDVENPLYFQTVYKEVSNELLHDITIFDKSVGKGRFLGMNVTAIFNPDYEKYWFGESEVKVYFDGDSDYPTLAGTGVEDYIGTAWGQNEFIGRYQGCITFNSEKTSFYRFHIVDPIFFRKGCKVTMQTIGGAPKKEVLRFLAENKQLCPVTADVDGHILHLYRQEIEWNKITDDSWVNFYRCDTYHTVAYLYVER